MKPAHLFRTILVLSALVAGAPAAARADILKDLKDAVSAGINPTVRGRVRLNDGQTLTCFEGVRAGYIGPPDMMSPGNTTRDPNTGTLTARTAAIPTMVMLPPATVTPNDCDALAGMGVLIPDGGAATPGRSSSFPPKTACRDVPEAAQAHYPRCISFDPQDHCSALPIDGTWGNGQTDLAAVCSSRHANAVIEEEDAYQRNKAQGNNAQAHPGASPPATLANVGPAHAGAGGIEARAAEGAKVCAVKPALMADLREEALQFVRFDKARDRIIMSEMVQGQRKEIRVDDQAFAKRASAAGADIPAGGVRCAVAYWDGEAIKAATAALSAGE